MHGASSSNLFHQPDEQHPQVDGALQAMEQSFLEMGSAPLNGRADTFAEQGNPKLPQLVLFHSSSCRLTILLVHGTIHKPFPHLIISRSILSYSQPRMYEEVGPSGKCNKSRSRD